MNNRTNCPYLHTSLAELFHQATQQVKQDQIISLNQGSLAKCFDCHNRERNYRIMLNLLTKYERLSRQAKL